MELGQKGLEQMGEIIEQYSYDCRAKGRSGLSGLLLLFRRGGEVMKETVGMKADKGA